MGQRAADFFLLVVTVTAAPVPVPSSIQPERMAGAKPRNVVFILSDDHRWDAMSFMGHPLADTPNMDRLAAEERTSATRW